MKKGLTIFFVLSLIVQAGGLPAQTPNAVPGHDTVVYDTIIEKTRFSYSVGGLFITNNNSFRIPDARDLGGGMKDDIYGNFYNYGYGGFFQGEWKYFVMGLDIYYHARTLRHSPFENTSNNGWNETEYAHHGTGGDLRFLFRLPLVNRDYTIAILAGPELSFRANIGISALAAFDLGFKLTQHHFFFLEYAQCFPLIDGSGNMYFAGTSPMIEKYLKNQNIEARFPFGMQMSTGIRVQVYKKTYYYKDHEVKAGR